MAKWVRYDFTANGSPILPARYEMRPNQYLQSPNKRFKLIFQNDGNLALYDGSNTVWVANASNPYTENFKGANASHTFLSMNYSLVLYDLKNDRAWSTTPSDPVDSQENASLRAFVQVQDDGNIVTIDTIPHWTAPTGRALKPGEGSVLTIAGPTQLIAEKRYTAGNYSLVYQVDGNLVVYGPGNSVVWASYTQNKGAVKCVMQADGNLVIYKENDVPLWHTGTNGKPSATVRLQDNGSLSIVTERPVWARFGYKPTIKPHKPTFNANSEWHVKSWTWDNVI